MGSEHRTFITNALAPAQLKTFEIDEARRRVKIWVGEDQLSLAIGKRGQNARLTAKLTGWQVDIDAERVEAMGFEQKFAQTVKALAVIPGISEEHATALVQHGLTSLEDLLQAEVSDLSGMPEIGDKADSIMEAAKSEALRRSFKVGGEPGSAASVHEPVKESE